MEFILIISLIAVVCTFVGWLVGDIKPKWIGASVASVLMVLLILWNMPVKGTFTDIKTEGTIVRLYECKDFYFMLTNECKEIGFKTLSQEDIDELFNKE